MDFFFRNMTEDCLPSQHDIVKCPFLRNINEPTNFSFSAPISFPMPVRGNKGPIFEDGPNFDMAFKLFHGQNGVVPLSEGPYVRPDKLETRAPPPQFNPLAAKAATISLGAGGSFGFDGFNDFWKKQNKSKSSKKNSSSQQGNSKHEMGEDWLLSGMCPIAKSYRAVSKVLPLVAKTLQLPAGMQYKCPPVIVAARAALSKTAFAKNLRPQPLPAKVLVIGVMGMAANIPLGIWREHTAKFSPSWFAAVHAAVPFIAMLRKSVLMPKSAMAFTIAASVLGQVIGSRAERYRLMRDIAARVSVPSAITETTYSRSEGEVAAKLSGPKVVVKLPAPKVASVAEYSQSPMGVHNGTHCGEVVEWKSLPVQVAGSSS